MKLLTVSVLVVAMMALTRATSPPKPETAPMTEPVILEDDKEESLSAASTDNDEEELGSESEDEEEEETQSTAEDNAESGNGTDAQVSQGKQVAKRSISCPCGWSRCGRRCFRYCSVRRTWSSAQRYCRAIGGNLASVHSRLETIWIRRLTRRRPVWIGFSDAKRERVWLWIDGTRTNYANWCPRQPKRCGGRRQDCARIRPRGRGLGCWDDKNCNARYGFVCARTI